MEAEVVDLEPRTKLPRMMSKMSNINLVLRTADQRNWEFIYDRSQENRNTQGFLPRSAIRKAIETNHVMIAEINAQPAGYILLTGGDRSPLVLRHNTVEREIWEKGHGTKFVAMLINFARIHSIHEHIFVRTRIDIDAQTHININAGGIVRCQEPHVGVRGKPVYVYRIPLWEPDPKWQKCYRPDQLLPSSEEQPVLFATLPQDGSYHEGSSFPTIPNVRSKRPDERHSEPPLRSGETY